MSELIDLRGARARRARLSKTIGKTGYQLLLAGGSVLAAGAVAAGVLVGVRFELGLAALALVCYLPAIWWKRYLSVLPPSGDGLVGRLSVDVLARLKPGMQQDPQAVWTALQDHWQALFFTNHLLLNSETIEAQLSSQPADLEPALQLAVQFADYDKSPTIELGYVVAGLLKRRH